MSGYQIQLFKQPLTAVVVGLAATLALAVSGFAWATRGEAIDWPVIVLVGLCLAVVGAAADICPVHVTYHTKVSMTSLVLYLIAVILPPPVAGLSAGLSRLIAELLERHKRGSFPSDIVTGVGRWASVAVAGAWVADTPVSSEIALVVVLLAAAVVMFLADVLSLVFELAPISADPPKQIVIATLRNAGLIEAVQYNLGILAALVVQHHSWELALLVLPIGAVYRAFKNTREMHNSTQQLLESLADAVDMRDPYTGGHSRRVTAYTAGILRELGLAGPDANLVITAARIHDIGKIGVPDAILNKPSALTAEEWSVMANHAARGADLLARYPDFARGVDIVRHHHERWDGNGYPDGLAGAAIPFGARVIAVADSFDAMTSDRPYRRGMPVEQAISILRDDNGRQWDARVVDAFCRSIASQVVDELGQAEEQACLVPVP